MKDGIKKGNSGIMKENIKERKKERKKEVFVQ